MNNWKIVAKLLARKFLVAGVATRGRGLHVRADRLWPASADAFAGPGFRTNQLGVGTLGYVRQ